MPRLTARANPSGSGARNRSTSRAGIEVEGAGALLDQQDAKLGAALSPQRGETLAEQRALAEGGDDGGDARRACLTPHPHGPAHCHRNLKRSMIKRFFCSSSSGGSGPVAARTSAPPSRPVERAELDRCPVGVLDEVAAADLAIAGFDAQRERWMAPAQVARLELDRHPLAARCHRDDDALAFGQHPGATIAPTIDGPHRRVELASGLGGVGVLDLGGLGRHASGREHDRGDREQRERGAERRGAGRGRAPPPARRRAPAGGGPARREPPGESEEQRGERTSPRRRARPHVARDRASDVDAEVAAEVIEDAAGPVGEVVGPPRSAHPQQREHQGGGAQRADRKPRHQPSSLDERLRQRDAEEGQEGEPVAERRRPAAVPLTARRDEDEVGNHHEGGIGHQSVAPPEQHGERRQHDQPDRRAGEESEGAVEEQPGQSAQIALDRMRGDVEIDDAVDLERVAELRLVVEQDRGGERSEARGERERGQRGVPQLSARERARLGRRWWQRHRAT